MTEADGLHRPDKLPGSFLLGATAEITENGIRRVTFTKVGRGTKNIVYVIALRDGCVIRVGETKGSLAARWSRPLRWLDEASASAPGRPNEVADMSRLLDALEGDLLAIWIKEAETHSFTYLGSNETVSLRHAEEVYLDRVLQPVVGRALNPRTPSAQTEPLP